MWGIYCRTCQECGHIQEAKPPESCEGDSWKAVKCEKCKSEALDFGHDGFYKDETGKIEQDETDWTKEE